VEINTKRSNRSRKEVETVLDEATAITSSVEKWFDENQSSRLETQIPAPLKRDLNELKDCISFKNTGAKKTANRLIAEALVDLFKKYKNGDGEFELVDQPSFRGNYK